MRRPGTLPTPLIALVVTVLLLGKALLTRELALNDDHLVSSLLLEGPLIVALVALVGAAARRFRWSALIVLDVFLSAVMFATAVYAAYFDQILTPALASLTGQAAEVLGSVVDLLRPIELLYVLDIPLLIAAAIVWRRRGSALGDVTENPGGPRRRLVTVGALAVFLAAVVGSGVLVAAAWRLPPDVNSVAAAKKWGLLPYQVAALKDVFVPPKAPEPLDIGDVADVEAEARRLTDGQGAERIATFEAGAFAGANLIVIQAEALQSGLVDGVVEGVEVTPNLNDLANESWHFPRSYSQISRGNTSDAEFVFNTSLYPPPRAAASVRWGDRAIPSLPRLLGDLGYRSVTFHANTARFWNRRNLYAALGFDRYYDREDLGHVEGWKWGSSDATVFERGLAELVAMRDAGQPFYAQFVTMTSHHPFHDPPIEFRPYEPPAALDGTFTGAYLSSESYADEAIGGFLDDLRRTGLWDESIVVVYGDHFGVRRAEEDAEAAVLLQLNGGSYNITDVMSVPFIVHLPGQTEGRVVDATVGQVDMLPTLADPLGLSLGGMPHFGRDAFTTSKQLLGQRGVAASGSMLNDRIIFQPGLSFDDGRAWDLRSGAEVATTPQDRGDFDAVARLMRLSLEYTDALPVREGAQDGDAIIPND